MGDFSTTITVINHTSATLGLVGFDAVQGQFPQGQPVNIIEPNTQADIYIKDNLGFDGSHGRCTYELHFDSDTHDTTPTISFDFGDPTGWNPNWLNVQTGSPDIVIDIQPYPQSGHPFHATVEIHPRTNVMFTAVATIPAENLVQNSVTESAVEPSQPMEIHAMYEIGFKDRFGFENKKPIHETIALAAFRRSKVYTPPGVEYTNLTPKQWEYMRGVIWNDDPSCLLFDDDPANNHNFGEGAEFGAAFKGFPIKDPRCMTQRSHFGDLQFLHAMAISSGEDAKTTKANCLNWLEVMYKLACGNQGISEQDPLNVVFKGKFFNNSSDTPQPQASLRELLLSTTQKYGAADIKMRALGSCLHIVADSFARGHVRRVWLNPEDLDQTASNGSIRFKEGTYGKCGAILTFHTYEGQDSTKHGHYDELVGDMPKPIVLNSFNKILGARDAIEKSTILINFWHGKTPWAEGVEQFLRDDVFKLDPNVTVGDTQVD